MNKAPTVTRAVIEEMMTRLSYTSHVPEGTTSTFVHAFLDLHTDRPFLVATGFAACVCKENFNSVIGFKMAKKDAMRKARDELWKLQGYLLKCDMDFIDSLESLDAQP